MSDKVKRWHPRFDSGMCPYKTEWMEIRETGDFVKYSDYARLAAENEKLRKLAELLIEYNEKMTRGHELYYHKSGKSWSLCCEAKDALDKAIAKAKEAVDGK